MTSVPIKKIHDDDDDALCVAAFIAISLWAAFGVTSAKVREFIAHPVGSGAAPPP